MMENHEIDLYSKLYDDEEKKHLKNIIVDLWGKEFLDNKKFSSETRFGKIINIRQKLDHDGYDRDGPKSNLYDLSIIFEKNGHQSILVYHREYWYRGEDDEPYTLGLPW